VGSVLFGFVFSAVGVMLLSVGMSQFIRLSLNQKGVTRVNWRKAAVVFSLLLKTAVPIGSVYCGIIILKLRGEHMAIGVFFGMVFSLWIISLWNKRKGRKLYKCENEVD
jgi:uncharacterized membrane protein (Fun14 family)